MPNPKQPAGSMHGGQARSVLPRQEAVGVQPGHDRVGHCTDGGVWVTVHVHVPVPLVVSQRGQLGCQQRGGHEMGLLHLALGHTRRQYVCSRVEQHEQHRVGPAPQGLTDALPILRLQAGACDDDARPPVRAMIRCMSGKGGWEKGGLELEPKELVLPAQACFLWRGLPRTEQGKQHLLLNPPFFSSVHAHAPTCTRAHVRTHARAHTYTTNIQGSSQGQVTHSFSLDRAAAVRLSNHGHRSSSVNGRPAIIFAACVAVTVTFGQGGLQHGAWAEACCSCHPHHHSSAPASHATGTPLSTAATSVAGWVVVIPLQKRTAQSLCQCHTQGAVWRCRRAGVMRTGLGPVLRAEAVAWTCAQFLAPLLLSQK